MDLKEANLDLLSEEEFHNAVYRTFARIIQFHVIWFDDICSCGGEACDFIWKRDMEAYSNTILRCYDEHWVQPMDLLPFSPKEFWETYGQHIQGRYAYANFKDYIPLLHEKGKNSSSWM